MSQFNVLAALMGVGMVCLSGLAALHIVPADVATHTVAAVVGASLAYLKLGPSGPKE